MTFPSWQYLLLFLPAVCLGHALLGRISDRLDKVFLIVASLAFYALVTRWSVLLLVLSVAVNGVHGRLLVNESQAERGRRLILGSGIVFNLLLIIVVRGATPGLGVGTAASPLVIAGHVFVSIGISFYSLQQIAFLFDCRRGVIRSFSPLTFCLASTFFPHLLAGPIIRYRELARQIETPYRERRLPDGLAMGLSLIVAGLGKHVLIAMPLSHSLMPVLGRDGDHFVMMFPEAAIIEWATILFIYFDFSAYSDLACGAACLLGFRMPVNFLSPLRTLDKAEFWRRWHITLSRFMRDYVFLPIYGSLVRVGKRRERPMPEEIPVAAATMAAFVLMGLWHGVGQTFLAWGLVAGAAVSLTQIANLRRMRSKAASPPTRKSRRFVWAMAMAGVLLASATLFTSPDLSQALETMRGIIGLNGISLPVNLASPLSHVIPDGWLKYVSFKGLFPHTLKGQASIVFGLVGQVALAACIGYGMPNVYELMAPSRPVIEKVPPSSWTWLHWRPNTAWAVVLGCAATVFIGMLANNNVAGFFYFRF